MYQPHWVVVLCDMMQAKCIAEFIYYLLGKHTTVTNITTLLSYGAMCASRSILQSLYIIYAIPLAEWSIC